MIKEYVYFIIKDAQGFYLTDPFYRFAWSPNPNTARRFMTYEAAQQATIKRAGKVVAARVFELVPIMEEEGADVDNAAD